MAQQNVLAFQTRRTKEHLLYFIVILALKVKLKCQCLFISDWLRLCRQKLPGNRLYLGWWLPGVNHHHPSFTTHHPLLSPSREMQHSRRNPGKNYHDDSKTFL